MLQNLVAKQGGWGLFFFERGVSLTNSSPKCALVYFTCGQMAPPTCLSKQSLKLSRISPAITKKDSWHPSYPYYRLFLLHESSVSSFPLPLKHYIHRLDTTSPNTKERGESQPFYNTRSEHKVSEAVLLIHSPKVISFFCCMRYPSLPIVRIWCSLPPTFWTKERWTELLSASKHGGG